MAGLKYLGLNTLGKRSMLALQPQPTQFSSSKKQLSLVQEMSSIDVMYTVLEDTQAHFSCEQELSQVFSCELLICSSGGIICFVVFFLCFPNIFTEISVLEGLEPLSLALGGAKWEWEWQFHRRTLQLG